MARHWHRFAPPRGLPVHFPTMPAGRNWFLWTGLYGIQIGPWFFGAIKGKADPSEGEGREGDGREILD